MTQVGKKKSIDPLTGLELTEIEPAPATQQQAFLANLESAPPPVPPPPQQMQVQNPFESPAPQAAPMRSSFLDRAMFTLFGTPDSKLEESDPQALQERRGRRSEASAMAKSAAENPGEAFMDIPVVGGKSLGESLDGPLSFMASLVSGIFGGGKGSGVG